MNKHSISTFLRALVTFTVPFAFAYRISEGEDFSRCFHLYLCVLMGASAAIRIIEFVLGTVRMRNQSVFKKTPRLPDWTGIVGAAMAFIGAIVVGSVKGFAAGMIVFWPASFLSMAIIYSIHWIVWQIRFASMKGLITKRILGF